MEEQTLVIEVPTGDVMVLGRFISEVSELCMGFGIEDMQFVGAPVGDVLAKLSEEPAVIQ